MEKAPIVTPVPSPPEPLTIPKSKHEPQPLSYPGSSTPFIAKRPRNAYNLFVQS